MNVIEINKLTKIYNQSSSKKKVNALNEVDLSIAGGTIFGLLGPNGAGKTTLVKILLGITFPTSGNASIFGKDLFSTEIKSSIGYLPESHRYPAYMTAEAVMKFFGRLSGLNGISLCKRTDELLELVKLFKWKRTKIKNYSKGMLQRLGLAQALLNDPELIFLDEPTDGVDPIGRKEIRDILTELKNRSKTIFLNSHLLSEVEMISDRVAILNNGYLLRESTVAELTESKEEFKIVCENDLTQILQHKEFEKFHTEPLGVNSVRIRINDTEELNNFIDLLRNRKIFIKEIVQQRSSLEDIFIKLIKEAEEGKET
ncbi:MAG: ABC transporter ATP-binding protein [Ignavibacteriaceae bacterium]